MPAAVADFDLDVIAAAIFGANPGIGDPRPLRWLGHGFHSIAFESARGDVVRVARSAEAMSRHRRERALLNRISSLLTVAVPNPRWSVNPCAGLPFGAMGYSKIPGRPLDPTDLPHSDALASEIAKFLFELHRIDPEVAGLSDHSVESARRPIERKFYNRTAVVVREELGGPAVERIEQWLETLLTEERVRKFTPRLRHGDMWYENILLDPTSGRLAGVLDFEVAEMGDPARDFATLRHVSDGFARSVFDLYRALGGEVDDCIDNRIQGQWELREFDGLQHIILNNISDELPDAIAKIRDGPILSVQPPFWEIRRT